MYENLIWKSPGYVQFGAIWPILHPNLITQSGCEHDGQKIVDQYDDVINEGARHHQLISGTGYLNENISFQASRILPLSFSIKVIT